MIHPSNFKGSLALVLTAAGAVSLLTLSGCKTAPSPAPAPAPAPVAAAPAPAAAPVASAADERAYRQEAARHLYAKHGGRVFRGKLPPNVPGVGVTDVSVDRNGNVSSITWVRRPSDPRFVPITEQLIRSAAPYPAPTRMGGRATWRDVWLWTADEKFQLDTLTEGQLRG
jgi:hypothetical protein